jgi:gluconokinase
MPASLLASQLSSLEPLDQDEPGVTVDGREPFADVVAEARAALGLAGGNGSAGAGSLP